MDQFKRTVIAVLQRLRGPAPAAIKDRGGGGNARVASFDRRTPSNALMAALVWLRASDRTSTSVLLAIAI
jgi:hypothetical protein